MACGGYGMTKVLILVMTYPNPSISHMETICTAGMTEDGEWVRLYPIEYRYLNLDKKFRKYQWIDVELGPAGNSNDQRKESRKPNLDTMCMLGEPIPPAKNWSYRKEFVSKLQTHTINELRTLYDEKKLSLGLVKPSKIIDLKIEPTDSHWRPEHEQMLRQFRLFGPQPKPLKKIPYKFSYIFECNDDIAPHRGMIEDWELGVLYMNERYRLGSDEKAAESVKKKYFNDICGPDKDTYFFMGTTFPWNSWVVLGVFYPKKDRQIPLF